MCILLFEACAVLSYRVVGLMADLEMSKEAATV